MSTLPAWIMRRGCRWEVGNVLGHCETYVRGLLGPAFRQYCASHSEVFFTSPGNMYKKGIRHSSAKITQGLQNVALANSFAELEIGQTCCLDGGHCS